MSLAWYDACYMISGCQGSHFVLYIYMNFVMAIPNNLELSFHSCPFFCINPIPLMEGCMAIWFSQADSAQLWSTALCTPTGPLSYPSQNITGGDKHFLSPSSCILVSPQSFPKVKHSRTASESVHVCRYRDLSTVFRKPLLGITQEPASAINVHCKSFFFIAIPSHMISLLLRSHKLDNR